MRRGWSSVAVSLALAGTPVLPLHAQAPLASGLVGRTIEVHALHQPVSNNYGDWTGVYGRVIASGTRQAWFLDALALHGFGERGVQAGVAHRFDWSERWFHMLGVNAGDGTPIFPRYRSDASVGRRWGAQRTVQTVAGVSYVQSVTELSDVAVTGAATWYAPKGVVLETGIRYNTSRPGNVRSHRLHGIAMYTPTARRSFSARAIGGTEGWQIVGAGATLTRFSSQELAVAWRERVGGATAINLQLDAYHNPFYTRSGVTFGVARYW